MYDVSVCGPELLGDQFSPVLFGIELGILDLFNVLVRVLLL